MTIEADFQYPKLEISPMPKNNIFLLQLEQGEMKAITADYQVVIEKINNYLQKNGLSPESLDLKGTLSNRAARSILDGTTKDPSYNNLIAIIRACGGNLVLIGDFNGD